MRLFSSILSLVLFLLPTWFCELTTKTRARLCDVKDCRKVKDRGLLEIMIYPPPLDWMSVNPMGDHWAPAFVLKLW